MPSQPIPPPGLSDEPAVLWQRLLDYYSSCVQQESALGEPFQRSGACTRYLFPSLAEETLLVGIEDQLVLDARTRALAQIAVEKGDSLYYGYPTVVLEDPARRKLVAPLFLIELALPAAKELVQGSLAVKSDTPVLHPKVISRFGLESEQVAALIESFPIEPHRGSQKSLQTFLRELAAEIPIPGQDALDLSRLASIAEDEINGIGLHNVAMVFRAESANFSERLLGELRDLRGRWAEARSTAAGLLFPAGRPQGSPADSSEIPIAAPLPLNESQRQALAGAFSGRASLVTGPPGTGKSQLVTNVIATAWLNGKTVLVASNNNQAVNVVCERAQKIWQGLIIRTGAREHRENARELLRSLLEDRSPAPGLEAVMAALEASRRRLHQVEDLIELRTRIETDLPELFLTREFLAGQLKYDLKALPRALEGRGLLRCLRQGKRLEHARFFRKWRTARLVRTLCLASPLDLKVAMHFLAAEAQWRELTAEERALPAIETLLRDKAEAERSFRSASEMAVRCQAARAFSEGKSRILQFAQTRSFSNDRNPVAEAFPAVLPCVRAWATTSLSAGANMPLRPGLFDLVVIDEASQCSIPATIPLFFRAKAALIIGDPNQLSHITSMSQKDEDARLAASSLERELVDQQGWSYRRHSVYDALQSMVPQPHVLDEHYRCHPQIIEISNRLFYGGRLAILTDPSKLFDFGAQACAWRHVQGEAVRPPSGSAENREEAQAVVQELLRIAKQSGFEGSVGVVTPFSAQAALIERLAHQMLPADLRQKIDLAVGTAHRFQGGERDVIVFSPVVSEGLPESSLRWILGTPNLFNVGITRARAYLLIVGNRAFCERLRGGSQPNVLKELALYVGSVERETKTRGAASRGDLHSPAETRLYEALLSLGLNVEPKRIVQGYECDFALNLQGTLINIECDGHQHQNNLGRLRVQDRARDRLLEQTGWKVIRVPAWKCLGDPVETAKHIAQSLKV